MTFPCPVEGCSTYSTRFQLKAHTVAKHEGHLRYSCIYCNKRFADGSDNRRHMKECKSHPSNLPTTQYVCAWWSCTYKTTRSDNAARHMKKCALKPTGWAEPLPAPVKVLDTDQVDGVMPDIRHRQVLPPSPPTQAVVEQEEQEGQGEELFSAFFGGGQPALPETFMEEPMALSEYTPEEQKALLAAWKEGWHAW